jgi:hypothetical protein
MPIPLSRNKKRPCRGFTNCWRKCRQCFAQRPYLTVSPPIRAYRPQPSMEPGTVLLSSSTPPVVAGSAKSDRTARCRRTQKISASPPAATTEPCSPLGPLQRGSCRPLVIGIPPQHWLAPRRDWREWGSSRCLTKKVLTVNGRTKSIRYATHNGGFIAGLLR